MNKLKWRWPQPKAIWHTLRAYFHQSYTELSQQWPPLLARLRRLGCVINYWGRRMFWALVILHVLLAVVIIAAHLWVEHAHSERIYDHVAEIPPRPVGLLLGTSKWVGVGRVNLYFRNRIEAAVALYEAGKIQHIIASGDNHRRGYNEPIDMLEALVARGIPRTAITLDYAGFRTLDSVIRANAIFSQTQFTIISQDFHNRRALFISQFYQLDAIAFNASDVTHSVHLKTQLREYLARVKAVLDLYILDTQPRFFGDKVEIELLPVVEEAAEELGQEKAMEPD